MRDETWPYLALELDVLYVRLAEEQGWWLVCPMELVSSCRRYAGWAPPDFFDPTPEDQRAYFEMESVVSSPRILEVPDAHLAPLVQPPRMASPGRPLRARPFLDITHGLFSCLPAAFWRWSEKSCFCMTVMALYLDCDHVMDQEK